MADDSYLLGAKGVMLKSLWVGVEGFEDLPIVVEIVDTEEKIEAFLPLVDGAIREGLATLEKVRIRLYRSGTKGQDSEG